MANKRKRNRRRRRGGSGFFYKLLTVLVICAVIVVAMTLFFKVDAIVVTGNVRYTDQEVAEAAGVSIGDNLFLLNKYAVDRRLREQLPYIETPHISRKLPDTLLISVEECGTTFALTQGGTVWEVSDTGKIVGTATPEEAADQPVIDGCELLAPSVGTYIALATEYQTQRESLLALLTALKTADSLDLVDAIHLGSSTELVMDYAGRFAVRMPYGADYDKMLLFVRTVMDTLESNETGTIDLTTDGEAHVLKD
jgi:cell division protein FtsQ